MQNLIGQKFGNLVVIERVGKNKQGNYKWSCKCNCGKETIAFGNNLKSGHTRSCGCFNKEMVTLRNIKNIKHGHARKSKESKIYIAWQQIIQRCINPNHKRYKDYGARGITVCKQWMKFENFLKDMGEAPIGYQIDRINNNKGYYKENCHWTNSKTNNRNKRNNHLETYNGKTQCISVWANEFNIHESTLLNRLNRGWSIKKALITPVRKKREK